MEKETNAERFIRVAENRVNKIADLLEGMAKMPRKDYYEYTPEQVATIFDYLREKIHETERAFITQSASGKFSLSETPDDK